MLDVITQENFCITRGINIQLISNRQHGQSLNWRIRMALSIDSQDGVDNLGGDVWQLGVARRAPVLLARDLTSILHQPDVLDRIRVPESMVRVIAPRQRHRYITRTGHDFEWLPMEEGLCPGIPVSCPPQS